MENRQLLDSLEKTLVKYKTLGDKTFDRLTEADIHFKKNETDNSIYILVKHLHGNMKSRFTDFLTEDGEKTWRNRRGEFEESGKEDKADMIGLWKEGWEFVLDTLHALKDSDMDKTVTISGEVYPVFGGLVRNITHYIYHIGQIVFIAKSLKGESWESLSVPRYKK